MKQLLLTLLTAGVLLGFVTGFSKAAGSSAWGPVSHFSSRSIRGIKAKRARWAAKRATARATIENANERARLQEERVGAKFLRRYTAEDVGTVVTVVGLADDDWRETVRVKELSPAARTPTEFEGDLPAKYRIKWSAMNKSESDQRRMTAHYKPVPPGGSDGWIEFERLD